MIFYNWVSIELLAIQWFFNMGIYCLLNRIFNLAPKFTNSALNRCILQCLWFKKRITLTAKVEVGDLEIVLRKAWDRAHFTLNCTHLQWIMVSRIGLPHKPKSSAVISFIYITDTSSAKFLNIWSVIIYTKQPYKSKSASKVVNLPCFWGYLVSPKLKRSNKTLFDLIWATVSIL